MSGKSSSGDRALAAASAYDGEIGASDWGSVLRAVAAHGFANASEPAPAVPKRNGLMETAGLLAFDETSGDPLGGGLGRQQVASGIEAEGDRVDPLLCPGWLAYYDGDPDFGTRPVVEVIGAQFAAWDGAGSGQEDYYTHDAAEVIAGSDMQSLRLLPVLRGWAAASAAVRYHEVPPMSPLPPRGVEP